MSSSSDDFGLVPVTALPQTPPLEVEAPEVLPQQFPLPVPDAGEFVDSGGNFSDGQIASPYTRYSVFTEYQYDSGQASIVPSADGTGNEQATVYIQTSGVPHEW